MKSKFAQLFFRILGYTALVGMIVVTISNLIDGNYFLAIAYFCVGLGVFVPQWLKKNQP
jgi:hypothetical protein